jgi:hypothetical protein
VPPKTKVGLRIRKSLAESVFSALPFDLHYDSQATLQVIKQNTTGVSGRAMHINVEFMILEEHYQRGLVEAQLITCALEKQIADVFTMAF